MGQKVLHKTRLVSLFSFSRTPANQKTTSWNVVVSIHPVMTGRCHVHPSLAFEWVNYTPTVPLGNIRKKFSYDPVKYYFNACQNAVFRLQSNP